MGAFGQALFSVPPTIGGVHLRPFSAYHAQALMEMDSPFIEGRNPTIGETVTALVVCRSCRRDGLVPIVGVLGNPIRRVMWSIRVMLYGHARTANARAEHVVSSMTTPRTWEGGKDGGGGMSEAERKPSLRNRSGLMKRVLPAKTERDW